jgi:tRNA U38,U39,U40 pseudouridine synthase TruA
MVRLIAAGLVEVGHGRISPAQFRKLVVAGDRQGLPVEAAPPHGLYLEKVGAAALAGVGLCAHKVFCVRSTVGGECRA